MKTPPSFSILVILILGFAANALNASDALFARALAPRSGDGTTMHFTAIPSAVSGISGENPYDEGSMWSSKYTEFQGGAIGTGIAAGDVDGDGRVDLYIVNKVRPNQLYRQTADFKFADITDAAGVPGTAAWQTGATFADVDNDGDLDLYVCQFNAPNLLYINDGSGTFSEEAANRGVGLVSSSVVGAFADYDRDGDLDLFVVTNVAAAAIRPDGEPDYLFRNDGKGSFTDVTRAAGLPAESARGHSATWFDANDDGWPDLYVANDFAKPDHLYQNNGDGTFTDTADRDLPSTPWFAMGSDFGDINNDGLTDLFVADMAGTTHFKSKVTMGDMGGLVDAMDTLDTPQYMRNALYVNTGTDRFMEIAQLAGVKSSDWSWSPRFADLDNDGWLDLHVTNGMVRSFIDSDLINATRRLPSRASAIRLMKNSPPLAETQIMFRNTGDLHFDQVQADWGLDHHGVSFGSVLADFDRDGDLDIAYTNFDDTISLYRNDSPSGNRVTIELQGTLSNRLGVGAKVQIEAAQGKLTRHLSVARGALSSSEPALHFGLGETASIDSLTVEWPSGHIQKFQDVEPNHHYTITEPATPATKPTAIASRPVDAGRFEEVGADRGLDFVNHEQRFNDMERQSLLPNRMNTLGGGLAVADVDGDQDPDVFFAGGVGQVSALYLNTGSGKFVRSTHEQPWHDQANLEQMAPLFFDLDGDGDEDLLVTSGGTEHDAGAEQLRDQLYLNDGSGAFRLAPPEQFESITSSSSVVTAGDFDRDGDLDVFIGGRVVPGEFPTAPESQLLENREGRLVDITPAELRKIGMVTTALWTDVDGDRRTDLLIAGEWLAPTVFSYNGSTLAQATHVTGFSDHPGWWNSLLARDIDQDGDIDYLAGNAGLNTKYHASPDHPVELYYGDFEGTGTCEIVEAEYEGDSLFPVRGRSCSSRAMPSLTKKFPTFRDFGAALLPEIYAPDKLEESLRLSVTQLASGVFENLGNGRFEFTPFPRSAAQAAPVFGLAQTGQHVLALQNFHGPQVETGWYNGGISMVFDSESLLSASTSGVAIPGEGRGAVTGDFDGDGEPEFIVTRINDMAQLYAPRTDKAGSHLQVMLHGHSGNPHAIGAKITAKYENGTRQSIEVSAGSGYLSQSQAVAFFPVSVAQEITSLEVVWPTGESSRYQPPQNTRRIQLTQPSTMHVAQH
ncbi:MAG: VCBS repeat-containing protein [Synoicihabitans sp.]